MSQLGGQREFVATDIASGVDVNRTLRIAAVDVAAGRGWAAGTVRSQGDGRLSPIKSRLALALKMLQALPCFNFARGAKAARPDAGQM
jgi:hypothetical protein